MADVLDAFWTLYDDLPRQGPGDRASLDWAMAQAGVPRHARILDAGCGSGADIAALLSNAPSGHVTAIDLHPPFTRRIRAAWQGDPRVTAIAGDMLKVEGRFEFIWSASAAYAVGVGRALRAWRRLLAPGGSIGFSEAVWLTPAPSVGARANALDYRAMTDLDGVARLVAEAGFWVIDHKVLSDAAWEAYYGPLEARVAALRPRAPEGLAKVLDDAMAEIAAWRACRREYGYAVFVVRPQ